MWEPPARARRSTFLTLLAVLACCAGVQTPSAAAAQRLPASVWALQQAPGSAPALAAARRLRSQGLNALVVDGRTLKPAAAKRLRVVARKAGLRLLVAAPAGRSAARACRASRLLGSAACAVRATSLRRVPALARRRGTAVVVARVLGPGQLLALRAPARGRLLAVVGVPTRRLDEALWSRALAHARRTPRLDVAFAGRVGSAKGRRLLALARGSRGVSAGPDAPAAPGGLAVAATTATSLTLAWRSGDAAAATFGVYVGGTRAGATSATAWTFGGLDCGTRYTLGVDAVAGASRSAIVSIAATTAACAAGGGGGSGGGGGGSADGTPPSAPTGVAKTGSTATSVAIGWSASSDDVGVAGYGVYIGSLRVGTTALTSYDFGALACGAVHSLGVDAYDAAGNRSARVSISAATSACPPGGGDTTPPSAPGGLAVTGTGESSLAVSWNASSDDVGVTGYGLYRNGTLVANQTSRTYTFGGLTCGTSYTLAVDARDAAANRSTRTSLTASTAACPPSPPVSGTAQRYVSLAGSDTGLCTAVAPCRSFNRAYRVAAPGEVVEVAAGSYPSQRIEKDSSKTSASDVLFRPAPGAAVTLAYLDIAGSHLEVRDLTATAGVDVDSNPIDTRDVTLRNLNGRSLFLRADDVTVIGGSYGGFNGCDAGMPEDGVKLWSDSSRGADNITLDGVLIHDIRRVGCDRHTDCIQIYSGTNHTIKNSTLVNCPTTGIIARPSSSSQALANITIENNYFGAVLDGSEAINIGTAPDRCSGIVVRYNTVVNESSSFDCVTPSGGPGSLVEGNIISVGSGNDATFRSNVFRPGSTLTGSGAVQCAPSYRNPSAGDWRLAPTDTCARNRGNPSSHPSTDNEGQPRPQGTIDAGADETT